MGKRFLISEDEKLNIRDLYKGIVNEQGSMLKGDEKDPKNQKEILPLSELPVGKYQVWVSMNEKHPMTNDHILRIMVDDQAYEGKL